jgi:hypothetical protein
MKMSINRQDCIALLLMLLISHAALTFHVTTHNFVDQTSCKFCSGHADPAHAIPPSTSKSLRPIPHRVSVENTSHIARAAEPKSYRERAPPPFV